jgi:uncharacterized protein (DUF362 family)
MMITPIEYPLKVLFMVSISSTVWIVKQTSEESDNDTTRRALELCNAQRLFTGIERVLVKPNWIIAEHYSRGNTTSTKVIEEIVKYLLSSCGIVSENIIVGDGGHPDQTDEAMRINDIFSLQNKYGIQVRNLNKEKMIPKQIPNPFALHSVNVAEIFDSIDVIISVAALKTHSMAITTLSMKNLMGLILPKGIMHGKLPQKIADLCSLFRPKMRLSLIAGITGSDGSEEGGNPVPMGLILVAEDPVALDTVGSTIIGYPPKNVPYLAFAAQKQLGTCDLNQINIVGPAIASVQKKFDR